ncbi:MAG: DM13 domain-containing protein [Chloroflexi bacterium]|nr:DM13 domain-containing protein [Chloroflexota bacterium]
MGGLLQSIRKYRGRIIVAAVIVAIPVLALAWWLGSPLFINKTVDEEFPYSVGAVVPEGMTRAQVDQTMETMASMEEVVSEAMPEAAPRDADEVVASLMETMTPEMMGAVLEGMSPEMLAEVAETMAETVPGMTPEMMAEAVESMTPEMMTAVMQTMTPEMMAQMATMMPEMMAPAGPVAVKQGMFRDADSFHKGEGSATLYTLPDGSNVLRLEDFRVTNGPDLRVILASHPDPMSRGNVHSGEYVELGKLKGNIGNQNYTLPEGLSPDVYNSVIIYCKPFQVLFSVAPLSEG